MPDAEVPPSDSQPAVEPPAEPPPEPADPPPLAPAGSSIADGTEHPLDPRYIPLQRIVGGIVSAAIWVGVLVSSAVTGLVSDLPDWAALLLFLLGTAACLFLAWVSYRWPVLEHRHHVWRLDGRGIEIRQGVWWRKVINVPRSRVQHTDVSQGPMERRFGLATLHIHTAGTEEAKVHLPGLDHAMALAVRDHLVAGGEDDAV